MVVVNAKGPLLCTLKGVTISGKTHHQDKKEGYQTLHEKPRLSLLVRGPLKGSTLHFYF